VIATLPSSPCGWPGAGRSLALALAILGGIAFPAVADRIENGAAQFSFLDKVTGRTSTREIPLNETFRFGSLIVRPRACYSRPPTEPPKTSTFVEVDEVQLNGTEKRIFAGWMFAESPGLNAVEHPVFDVWLTGCTQPVKSVSQAKGAKPASSTTPQPAEPAEPPRRRVRR
jgi:hypothetical protein